MRRALIRTPQARGFPSVRLSQAHARVSDGRRGAQRRRAASPSIAESRRSLGRGGRRQGYAESPKAPVIRRQESRARNI